MEQLKMLLQYTIFHIGLYATLTAALIALLGLFPGTAANMRDQLTLTLVFFLLAGICGGIVASNIPHFTDWDTFYTGSIGVWSFRLIPAWLCMRLEHTFFWLGIGTALWGLCGVRHAS